MDIHLLWGCRLIVINTDFVELFGGLIGTAAPAGQSDIHWSTPYWWESQTFDTKQEIALPDACIIKQWIVQPWQIDTAFDEPSNSDLFQLYINDDLVGQHQFSSANYKNSRGEVTNVDLTVLKGTRIQYKSLTSAASNSSTNGYKISLTGIWLRD